jgi:O-antigen/teichoic acid export membrane protein
MTALAAPAATPVAAPREEAEQRRATRGAALTLFGTVAGAVGNFAMLALITRAYGDEGFGSFSGVSAFFLAITMFTRLGADMGATWFVARLRAQGNIAAARQALVVALAPVMAASTAAAVGMFVLVGPVARLLSDDAGEQAFTSMLRIVIVAVPLAAVGEVLLGATRGYGDMRPTVYASQFGRQLGQLLLVAVAAVLSSDLRLLALAWVLPYVGTVAYPAMWLQRQRRSTGGGSKPWAEFWRYSGPQGANQTAQIGLEKLDIILVGPLAGLAAQGAYNGANRLAHLVVLVWYAVNLAHGPVWARLFEQGRNREVARSAQKVTVWATLLVGPMLWAFVVFGDVFTWLLGADADQSGTALGVLGIGLLVALLLGPCENLMLMAGRSARSFLNNLVALGVNAALNVLLIPRLGIVGAALAWVAALFVVRVQASVQLWRSKRVLAFSRPLAVAWLASAATIGGGGVLAERVLGSGHVAALSVTLALGLPVLAAVALLGRRLFGLDELLAALRSRRGGRAQPGEADSDRDSPQQPALRLSHVVDAPHLEFRIRSRAAIALPLTPRRLSLLLDTVPPSGWRGRLVRAAVGGLARRGPQRAHLLPFITRHAEAPVPVDPEILRHVLDAAAQRFGGTVDGVLWLLPPGGSEARVGALLLHGDTAVAHLRVRDEPLRVQKPWPRGNEGARTGIVWPELLDRWYVGDHCCELTTVLRVGPHQPADVTAADLTGLVADLDDALAGETPAGVPARYRPMHGDLTPWNLRRSREGRVVLFDWEHAGYGPPHADLVRYLGTSGDGLQRFSALPERLRAEAAEAIEYWMVVAAGRARSGDGAWKRQDRRREWERFAALHAVATGEPQPALPAALDDEPPERRARDLPAPACWPTRALPAARRSLRLVLALTLAGGVVAAALSQAGWRTYRAASEVVLNDPWTVDPAVNVRPVGGDYERFVRRQIEFMRSAAVVNAAAAALDESPGAVRDAIAVTSDLRAHAAVVEARGASPSAAARRRDALIDAYGRKRRAALAADIDRVSSAAADPQISAAVVVDAAVQRSRAATYDDGIAYVRPHPPVRMTSTLNLALDGLTGAATGAAAALALAWRRAARPRAEVTFRLAAAAGGVRLLGIVRRPRPVDAGGTGYDLAAAALLSGLFARPQRPDAGRLVVALGADEALTRAAAQVLAEACRRQGATVWVVPGGGRDAGWPDSIVDLTGPGEVVIAVCPPPAEDAAGLRLAGFAEGVLTVATVDDAGLGALTGAVRRVGAPIVWCLGITA